MTVDEVIQSLRQFRAERWRVYTERNNSFDLFRADHVSEAFAKGAVCAKLVAQTIPEGWARLRFADPTARNPFYADEALDSTAVFAPIFVNVPEVTTVHTGMSRGIGYTDSGFTVLVTCTLEPLTPTELMLLL